MSSTSTVDPQEIGEAVYRQLASDEAERIEGDDRRYLHDLNERNEHWPDLVPVRPSPAAGMELDHAEVYGSEVADLAREYRAAYARRDPTIVSAETAIELKRRGAS